MGAMELLSALLNRALRIEGDLILEEHLFSALILGDSIKLDGMARIEPRPPC
jgi:hypothetical protein